MAKRIDYGSMFSLRSDGRYQGYWHEPDKNGEPKGKRHAICDRDPERLYYRIREKESPTVATLAKAASEWEIQYRQTITPRTWANMRPHYEEIVDLYGKTPIAEVTAQDVTQDLQRGKTKNWSRTVVNTRRVVWNGIFDYAVGQGLVSFNPVLSVKLPKGLKQGKRSAPTDEMVKAILAGANDMGFGFIPFFLLCTGCRRNEALQRKKSDVNTETWELTIPKSKTEAGIRTVPIIKPLQKPLDLWMRTHPGEWLFPYQSYHGRTGQHMTDTNWDTAWAKYCKAHGWVDAEGKPTIGAHHLRHGTATLLFEAGVDPYTAQHILGHAQVTTTMAIYTELRDKQRQKNVKKFGKAIEAKIKK